MPNNIPTGFTGLLEAAKGALCILVDARDWREAVRQQYPFEEAPYGDLARAILAVLPVAEADAIRRAQSAYSMSNVPCESR